MLRFLFYLFLIALTFTSCMDNGEVRAWHAILYKDTPVYDVAKAIKRNDGKKIKRLLEGKPESLINYQEPIVGQTLITFATRDKQYEAVKALAELGADPNIQDNDGRSAFLSSCSYLLDINYMKTLLEHGGDVNAVSNSETPLNAACRLKDIEFAKILIGAGANPHYIHPTSTNFSKISAINAAFSSKQIHTVDFLINELGVVITPDRNPDGLNNYLFSLRNMIYPLGSEEHQLKMKIIKKLEAEYDMDYRSSEIPDFIRNNIAREFPDVPDYLDRY